MDNANRSIKGKSKMTFDLSKIEPVQLQAGAHRAPEDGLCFMEMVAWFDGEVHSDNPECACPILGAYGIRLNDNMGDEDRNKYLLPLVPLMAGTSDEMNEKKRVEFLAMWAVNKILPIALGKYPEHAQACADASNLKDAAKAAKAAAKVTPAAAKAAAANAAAGAVHSAVSAAGAAGAGGAAGAAVHVARIVVNSNTVWQVAVEGLRQAIMIGRHDGFTEIERFNERADKLLELVEVA